jgi:hypothetical protein
LDRIYAIESIEEKNGNQQYNTDSPTPLGLQLKNDFPQIKNAARTNFVNTTYLKSK